MQAPPTPAPFYLEEGDRKGAASVVGPFSFRHGLRQKRAWEASRSTYEFNEVDAPAHECFYVFSFLV